MDDFFQNFNPADADNAMTFDLLPAGEYLVTITRYEEKTSKAGSMYVNFMVDIIEGQFKNRKVFYIVNMNHEKDTVRKAARGDMTRLFVLAGITHPKSYSELIGKVFKANIGVNPAKDGYPASNQVKSFSKATPDAPIPVTLGNTDKPAWA